MFTTHHTRVLIIGAGPAGYTAGIYTARANLQPLLVQGMQPGGQLTITTEVENYPGFAQPVQGPDLMLQMQQQAETMGTQIIGDMIVTVDFSHRPFRCVGDSGDIYLADSVIIATGAQARWLGLPSEKLYQGFGVSACATCDGFFFRTKTVAVIGGGNTAVEEALYLTHHAHKVYLIHRRDSLRAEQVLQERMRANAKIEPVWNCTVEEIIGEGDGQPGNPRMVTGVWLRDHVQGGQRALALDGVFVAIGHVPATRLFQKQIAMDDEGYILTAPNSTATTVEGVFAAGDVKDKLFRQAVTAAGSGCMAALEAERWLMQHAEGEKI